VIFNRNEECRQHLPFPYTVGHGYTPKSATQSGE
jgi:hypothetical protein